MMSSDSGTPLLNRESIRAIAHQIRDIHTAITGQACARFDVIHFLEVVLPKLDENFSLEVCEQAEMREDNGLMIPSQNLIKIREDVYANALKGQGRDRFTITHELGHYILHRNLGLAFRTKPRPLAIYQSIEWQADCFAGELLVDSRLINAGTSMNHVAQLFGVSTQAAEYQLRQLKLKSLI